MNVMRLDGRQLNYWVAKSAGLNLSSDLPAAGTRHDPDSGFWHPHTYNPANDWSQAGPIISNEWFGIEDTLIEWFGPQWPHIPGIAENPLKWFMRAYVATQFGFEVEDIAPLGYSVEVTKPATTTRPTTPAQPAKVSIKSWLARWWRPISW